MMSHRRALKANSDTVVIAILGSTTYCAPRLWAALRLLRHRERAARPPDLHGNMG